MNGRNMKLGRTGASLLAVALAVVLSTAGMGGMPRTAYSQEGQAVQPEAGPYSYAFTYQGQLKKAAGPVNGTCDFTFSLYDDPSAGNLLGTQNVPNVTLADGVFTARLDFGAAAHTGGARWLLIALRCPAGSGSYTALDPRQELTGAPAALALALPFTAAGSSGGPLLSFSNSGLAPALALTSQGGNGLHVISAGGDSVHVDSAGLNGVVVDSAGWDGVDVYSAGDDGVYVNSAGTPSAVTPSPSKNGFEVAGAEGNGLCVGSTGLDGVYIYSTGDNGVQVDWASADGVFVNSADDDGVAVFQAGTPPATTPSDGKNGFEVAGAEGNGLYVGAAGWNGVHVNSADGDGVYVSWVGTPPAVLPSVSNNGFEVAGAEGNGLYVGAVGGTGVGVVSAGYDGVYVGSAGHYAGYFNGAIWVSSCTNCALTVFGRNAGNRTLAPGDVVAIQGIEAATLDNAPQLWKVAPAGGAGAVIGVVSGRAELDLAWEGQAPGKGQTGQRLVPRKGTAQPGEYLTIVVSGPMQIRAAAKGAGAIQPGTRLVVGPDGLAGPLKTVVIDGVTLSESAPILGIALEAPNAAGLVWVLVNPQ